MQSGREHFTWFWPEFFMGQLYSISSSGNSRAWKMPVGDVHAMLVCEPTDPTTTTTT